MATTVVKSENIERVLRQRINRRINQFRVKDSRFKAAMLEIAALFQTEIVFNITRQRLIDTSRLRNSIRFALLRKGNRQVLEVGSRAVPYAAIHEFGFNGPVTVQSHRRLQTSAFGRRLTPPQSTEVRQHIRQMNIRARPYIRPATKTVTPRVTEILRDLFNQLR